MIHIYVGGSTNLHSLLKIVHVGHLHVFFGFGVQYVEPVLEKLDQKGCIRYRLSRDATQYVNGKHLRVNGSNQECVYPKSGLL